MENQNANAPYDQQTQYYPLPNLLPQTTFYSSFDHPVDSNSDESDEDSLHEPDSNRTAYEMFQDALNAFNQQAEGQNDLENDQEGYLDEDLEEDDGFEEDQEYEEDQNPISHQPELNYEVLNAFYSHEQFQQDQENSSYFQQEMSNHQQESIGQLMQDAYQPSVIQPQAIYPYFGSVMYPPVNYPALYYFLPLQPTTFDFYSIQC